MTSGVCRRLPQPAPWDLPFTSGLMALVQATGHLRGHRMRRTLVTAIALALAGVTPSPSWRHRRRIARSASSKPPRSCRATCGPTHYDVAVVPHADIADLRRPCRDHAGRAGADRVHHPQRGRHDVRQRVAGRRPASGAIPQTPKVSIDADAQTATFTFAQAAAAGPLHAGDGLHRQDRHAGQRPVRDRLRHQGRQEARAVHAVRELRCAQVHPVVGRAEPQGDVHADGDGAGRADGGQQHAGGGDARTSATA